jgi:hypothetical protein
MRIVGLARAVGCIERSAHFGHLLTPPSHTAPARLPMAQTADGRQLERA